MTLSSGYITITGIRVTASTSAGARRSCSYSFGMMEELEALELELQNTTGITFTIFAFIDHKILIKLAFSS